MSSKEKRAKAQATADAEAKNQAKQHPTAQIASEAVEHALDNKQIAKEPSITAITSPKTSFMVPNRQATGQPLAQLEPPTLYKTHNSKETITKKSFPKSHDPSKISRSHMKDARDEKAPYRYQQTKAIHRNQVVNNSSNGASEPGELTTENSSKSINDCDQDLKAKSRDGYAKGSGNASSSTSTKKEESHSKSETKNDIGKIDKGLIQKEHPAYIPDDSEKSLKSTSERESDQGFPGAFAVRGLYSSGENSVHSISADVHSQHSIVSLTESMQRSTTESASIAKQQGELIEAFVVEEPEYVPQVMAVSEDNIKRRRRIICFGISAIVLANIVALAIIQPNEDLDISNKGILFEEESAITDAQFQFIPGTQKTISGYDNELGSDAVCWRGQSFNNTNSESSLEQVPTFPDDPLVKDFILGARLDILQNCPDGTNIEGFVPDAFGTAPHYKDGIRPLTGETYDYEVIGRINLLNLDGSTIVSDEGSRLAIQVVLCELGKVGFCTPFVHEQTNARLESLNRDISKTKKGDRHGGSHVHSGYIYTDVNVSAETSVVPFRATVPMVVNDPGDFFAIVAVSFYTANSEDEAATFRYDVSNAFDNRIVFYQDPPYELKVKTSVKAITGVWISVSSLVILFFLTQAVKYRSEVAMAKSQGSSLIVFICAALSATVTSFLLIPKSDLYCKIGMPLVMISLQIVYAVLIARLWRIQKKRSPLVLVGGSQNAFIDGFTSFVDLFAGCKKEGSPSNDGTMTKNQTVTYTQLARVAMVFCMPQLLLQILSLAVQPRELYLDLSEDESIGRTECSATNGSGKVLSDWKSLETYGILFLVLTCVLALVLANLGRNLPSLFNEAEMLNDTLLTSTILMIFGACMILLLDEEATLSPNLEYIIWIATITSTVMNLVVRIMLPKLRMIWRGDTIILPSDDMMDLPSAQVSNAPSQIVKTHTSTDEIRRNNTFEEKGLREGAEVEVQGGTDEIGKKVPVEVSFQNGIRQNTSRNLNRPLGGNQVPILISDEEAPPRSLLVRMVDHENMLRHINARIMSGQPIPHEVWKKIHATSIELGAVFSERVEFSWENNQYNGVNG